MSEQTTKKQTEKANPKDKVNKQDSKQNLESSNNELESLVNIFDLPKEDLSKLPKVSIIIARRSNKKKTQYFYNLEIRLHEMLIIKRGIDDILFNTLILEHELDNYKNEHSLRVPCRLVTGLNTNGKEYHQIELSLSDTEFYTEVFFSPSEYKLFKLIFKDTVKFVNRPQKIQNQNIDGFDQQE